jgi:hypothetical protein
MDRASRLRMDYTAMLLRSYGRRMTDAAAVVAAFDARLDDPRRVQEETLHAILARNAGCEYGRRYDFAGIRGYEEYRARVPVVGYEDLRPSVERMIAGDGDVLVRGVASYFSTTSGSTAAPKFVPGTQQTITAGCEAILARNAYLRRDHPAAFAGRPLFVVGNMAEGSTSKGVTFGAMTGFGYQVAHLGFSGTPLPHRVFSIQDHQARYYCILRLALAAADLSLVSVYNPSTLVLLIETARTRWDELVADVAAGTLAIASALDPDLLEELRPLLAADPARAADLLPARDGGPRAWWPSLAAVLCWKGGALGFYLTELERWLGTLPVRDLGIVASEGMITIPVDDAAPGGVLLPDAGFFEFVPRDAGPDEARGAWDLEQGGEYRVLLTTHGGLYRYELGDVVQVVRFERRMPVLSFLHRAGRVHSFTGEKLTEHQVTLAVGAAAAASGLRLSGFTAVPCFKLPPFYELRAELAGTPGWAQCRHFASRLDVELAAVNIEYASKRESGRLARATLALVAPGSFERQRHRRVTHEAQYKPVHLASDPDQAGDLEVTCRI